jgi:uncharacterized protein (UPF0332 family)
MSEPPDDDPYLRRAELSLLGTESEYDVGRYENCANRCYSACFRAAIAALRSADIRPAGNQWGHDFVESRFVGQLVDRRHRYPRSLRSVLADLRVLRQRADYGDGAITQTEAFRGLRRAREFVEAIRTEGATRR